jgi:hypothetical protein
MKRLVEFRLDDESTILLEINEPDAEGGMVRAGRADELPEQAKHTFEQALTTITPAAESIMARLRGLSNPPDQIGLEFGVKLSGKAQMFVISADTEGNFKITLTWKGTGTKTG